MPPHLLVALMSLIGINDEKFHVVASVVILEHLTENFGALIVFMAHG